MIFNKYIVHTLVWILLGFSPNTSVLTKAYPSKKWFHSFWKTSTETKSIHNKHSLTSAGFSTNQEKKMFCGPLSGMSHYPLSAPRLTGENFIAQTISGYKTNAIVYRCVSFIARSISSIPLYVYQDNEKLSDHPLLHALRQTDPFQRYSSFC